MVNYYGYLWRTTWPEVVLTSVIVTFILGRLVWKVWRGWKNQKRWGRLILLFRVSFWLVILSAYFLMFSLAEPDWFLKPVELRGEVQGKALTDSTVNPYSIDVKSGATPQTFWVDYHTFKTVNPGDRIIVNYLPSRREVYHCEVLP